jgi:GT2 family glycosyltransferase/exopolysaccharide biosynthesis predicted pyruvyltransferase EpsI
LTRAALGLELDRSRTALLAEIGSGRDLTLVRPLGNRGDELILAGTRELLEGLVYREIDVDELPFSRGDTALICGGGAWSRPYHEWAPRATAVAELRFARVIVLPSSFDVSVEVVRDTLQRTSATVFAREHESFRRIQGLCRARLAHDCAFFFDFASHDADGAGILNAFRTDREATAEETPDGNDDISVTADNLEDWLAQIARHAHVRTDRAHVMIAAALLGKTVEFQSGPYHKLDSLAATWLADYPVRHVAQPRPRFDRRSQPAGQNGALRQRLQSLAGDASAAAVRRGEEPRITVLVLTEDRSDLVRLAVTSALRVSLPVRVLVIGNNSSPASRERLRELSELDPRVELRLLDRDLGCAGGRRLGSEIVETELMMFLDDDAELIDGALEHLCAELDAHPEAVGVTARVVGPDGRVQHCGGEIELSDDLACFTLGGSGLRFDDPAVPATGYSGWLPGTGALIRTEALREFPLDPRPLTYYEDNDWSMRVTRDLAMPFRRCRDAVVLHHNGHPPVIHACELARVSGLADLLSVQAEFLERHGVLLDVDLRYRMPELGTADGGIDLDAAKLLLGLLLHKGTDWFVAEWMNGGLEPLRNRGRLIERQRAELESARSTSAERDAALAQLEAARAAVGEALADERRESIRLGALTVDLTTELEAQRAALSELQANSAWLSDRHAMLVAIENGGWWRLRGRLRPLLLVLSAARRWMTLGERA